MCWLHDAVSHNCISASLFAVGLAAPLHASPRCTFGCRPSRLFLLSLRPSCPDTFNTHKAKHLFCSVCGICSFYRPRSHPSSYSVNLLALDDYALLKARGLFAVEPYDGRNWESARGALAQVESGLGLDAMAADAEGATTAADASTATGARPGASSALSPAATASASASATPATAWNASAARRGFGQNGQSGSVSYVAASSTASAASAPAPAPASTSVARSNAASLARAGAGAGAAPGSVSGAVEVIRVGVLCVRKERSAGEGTYSPGLEHDAKLYERALTAGLFQPAVSAPTPTAGAGAAGAALAEPTTDAAPASTALLSADDWPTLGGANSPAAPSAPPALTPVAAPVRFEIVQLSPRWDAEGAASAETLHAIQEGRLDAVLALEELGGADMIAALRGLKGHHLGGGGGSACVGGCTPQSHSSLPSYSGGPICCPLPAPIPPPSQSLSPRPAPAPAVVWVPNCEVLDGNPRSRWRPTLEALHAGVVDAVVAKMPRLADFLPCIAGVYRAWGGGTGTGTGAGGDEAALEQELGRLVVHCPHTCWIEDEEEGTSSNASGASPASARCAPSSSASVSPASVSASPAAAGAGAAQSSESNPVAVPPEQRRTILHFAGSSPHKNTLENSRAGLELVRALNAEQALAHERAVARALAVGEAPPAPPMPFTFVVFVCSWPARTQTAAQTAAHARRNAKAAGGGSSASPSNSAAPSASPRYSLGPGALDTLSSLAAAHPAEFRLLAGGFMSYDARAELYARTRLALCASRAEGFGHYVLEAAASGALVVTTDGAPMSSLLCVPGSYALAAPEGPPGGRPQHFGTAYSVPAAAIVAAARRLPLLESEGYGAGTVALCRENEARARAAFAGGVQRLRQRIVDLVWRNRAAAARPPQGLGTQAQVQAHAHAPVVAQAQHQHQQRRALPHTLPAFFTEGVPSASAAPAAAPASSPPSASVGAPLPRSSPPPPGFGWAPAASPLALAPSPSPPPGFGLSPGQSPRLAPQGSPPGFGPLHLPLSRTVGAASPVLPQPQQSPPSGSWAAVSFQQSRAVGGMSAPLAGFPPLSSPSAAGAAPAPAPAGSPLAQSSPLHAHASALPVGAAAFSLADFEAQLLSRAKAQQQQQR